MEQTLYLILRGNAFLFTFFPCEGNGKLGTRARCPGYERWASSLCDVEQRLSVMERAALLGGREDEEHQLYSTVEHNSPTITGLV
jgi:hypothetical protein